MNNKDNHITKRKFWLFLVKKLPAGIGIKKIFNVINILFDEIIQDLLDGKTIVIDNFASISLKQTNPKSYFDIVRKTEMISKPRNILKFQLDPKIKQVIISKLDQDATLEAQSKFEK